MATRTLPKVSALVGAPVPTTQSSTGSPGVFLGKFDSHRAKSDATLEFVDRNRPRLAQISLSLIDESEEQNRLVFEEDALLLLGETLKVHQVEPIVLREKANGRYEMRSGHRRRRGAMMVGMTELMSLVYGVDADVDNDRIGLDILIANEQREALGDFERALGYQRKLAQTNISQAELARRLGIDRTLIVKRMAFFRLPQSAQDALHKYPRVFSHRFLPEILAAIERAPGLEQNLVNGIIAIGAGESRPELLVNQLVRMSNQSAQGKKTSAQHTSKTLSVPGGRHVCTMSVPKTNGRSIQIKLAKGVDAQVFSDVIAKLIESNPELFSSTFEQNSP